MDVENLVEKLDEIIKELAAARAVMQEQGLYIVAAVHALHQEVEDLHEDI